MLHGCCDCVLNTPALLLRLSGDILKRRPPCSHSVASLKLLNFLKTLTRHSILLNRKSIFKKRLILQDGETLTCKKFNDENDMNWQFLIFIARKKSWFSFQKSLRGKKLFVYFFWKFLVQNADSTESKLRAQLLFLFCQYSVVKTNKKM